MDRSRASTGMTLRLLSIAICVLLLLHPTITASAATGVVTASEGRFLLDGRPWRPTGFNQYRLTSIPSGYVCDGGYGAISDSSLARRLDQMKAAGATVVRTWFFQSYYQGYPTNPWRPFDRLVNAAAARGMKVIPVLVNHWADCEPSAGMVKTIGFYQDGYRRENSYGYSLSFRSYARKVAERYASNTAVAFWQLVNEAEAPGVTCNEPEAARALRWFADDMAQVLHSLDPAHLVSLGSIGTGQCGMSGDNYRYVHAGSIDICDVHDYESPSQAMPGDQWNGMQLRLNQCTAQGKPIFVGEAGIQADVNEDGSSSGTITATTLLRRARFFDAKMAAQFAGGLDGYLIWEKIAESSSSTYNLNSGRYGVGPNDRTEAVTRGWSGLYGNVRSDWENGTLEGWGVTWPGGATISVSNTTSSSFTRLRSLQIKVSGTGWPAVSAAPVDLTPGKTVSYRVYKPASSPVGARLFTTDNNWEQHFTPDLTLSGGWNTLTFVVPEQPLPLRRVGLQVNNGAGWTGRRMS